MVYPYEENDIHTVNLITGGIFFGDVYQAGSVNVEDLRPVRPALDGLPAEFVHERLVGRADDIASICTELTRTGGDEDAAEVYVISGAPGVGKTVLAIQAANRLRTAFDFAGCLYLPFYDFDDRRRVSAFQALGTALESLGVANRQIPSSPAGRQQMYRTRLAELDRGDFRIVVLVDDVATVESVRDVLPPPGSHRLIVTSRNALIGLPGQASAELSGIGAADAAELVRHRLARAGPRGRLTDRDVDAITDVCCGLPLALHVVADLLLCGDSAADSLIDKLRAAENRVEHLQSSARSLSVVFEASYRALSVEAAAAFRLVSAHPANTVPVEDLTTMLGEGPRWADQALQTLHCAHLIRMDPESGLIHLHGLIRDFGQRKAADDERATHVALDRLTRNLISQAASVRRSAQRGTGNEPERVAASWTWLTRHRESIVRGAGYALGRNRPGLCLDLALAAAEPFQHGAFRSEWLELAELGHQAARTVGANLVEASINLGRALYWNRRWDESIAIFQSAISDPSNERIETAPALRDLAAPLRVSGRHAEARTALVRAEGIARRNDDRYCLATILTKLAQCHLEVDTMRDLPAARAALNEAFELFVGVSDLAGEAAVLINQAFVSWHSGDDPALVLRTLQSAVDRFRSCGDVFGEALAYTSAGNALADLGWLPAAVAAHVRATQLFHSINDRYGQGRALANLSSVLLDPRFPDVGGRIDHAAHEILRQEGHEHGHELAIIRRSARSVRRF